MVPLALCSAPVRGVEQLAPLSTCEPVSDPDTQFLCALNSPNAGCQVRAEQAIVSGFVCESTHRSQPQVDGRRSKPPCLQLISIAKNNGATERYPGLGTVPGNEVVDRVGIGAF